MPAALPPTAFPREAFFALISGLRKMRRHDKLGRKTPEKLATVSCGSFQQTNSTSVGSSDFIAAEGKQERK